MQNQPHVLKYFNFKLLHIRPLKELIETVGYKFRITTQILFFYHITFFLNPIMKDREISDTCAGAIVF